MSAFLVYSILLAFQLVGFEAADRYTMEVLDGSVLVHALDVRREGSILRLVEGDETALEIERSQLYAHMYTTYTSAQAAPRAFSLLDAVLQVPVQPLSSFAIALDGEEIPEDLVQSEPDERVDTVRAPNGGTITATTSPDGAPPQRDDGPTSNDAPTATPNRIGWTVHPRNGTFFLTSASRGIVVVLRPIEP